MGVEAKVEGEKETDWDLGRTGISGTRRQSWRGEAETDWAMKRGLEPEVGKVGIVWAMRQSR